MKKLIGLLIVAIIAALPFSGCGSTELSSSKGTFTVLVTDAPSYTVNSVVVHFAEVWVHRAAGGEDDKGQWIQLNITGGMLSEGSFDLALLRDEGETQELVSANLTAGKYTQLLVVMDEELGVQLDYDDNEGAPVNAKLPSGTLKFVCPFIVEEDGSTEIVLDFDLEKSVVFTGNFDKGSNPRKPDKPSVIVKPVVKLQITSIADEQELDGELILENKDPDTWAIIDDDQDGLYGDDHDEDDVFGVLRYSTEGEEFAYDFQGFGLDNIEYSLIYYADTEDRFNVWGGDGPGALIATGIAVDGKLTLSGSVYLGMDLPHPNDANGYFYDYTLPPDEYDESTGVKIWLVPSECYDATEPLPIYKVTAWDPARFLFETDLITYSYTDITAPAMPTGLTSVPGNAQVSLNWDDNADVDLKEYIIYRADVSGGPYGEIATATVSEYTDNTVTNDTTYYYVVTAIDNNDNESSNSDESFATPTSS